MIRTVVNTSEPPPGSGRSLPDRLAALVDHVGGDGFADAAVRFLRDEAPFDSALVLVYRPDRRPEVLLDLMHHQARENTADHYVGGAYLLDPFYRRADGLADPAFLRMRDIAPADFLASDYYLSYYKHSHVVDEVNLLLPDGFGGVLALCLERSISQAPFSGAELAGVAAWRPFLAALVRRHAAFRGPPADSGPDAEHSRLLGIVEAFGAGVLTAREREIVRLILRGHTAPAVALTLGLSVETVRVHRRNIYAKLRITSLAELFSLVLNALYTSAR